MWLYSVTTVYRKADLERNVLQASKYESSFQDSVMTFHYARFSTRSLGFMGAYRRGLNFCKQVAWPSSFTRDNHERLDNAGLVWSHPVDSCLSLIYQTIHYCTSMACIEAFVLFWNLHLCLLHCEVATTKFSSERSHNVTESHTNVTSCDVDGFE